MSKENTFIKKNKIGFLATVDMNGQPKVRSFGVMEIQDNRLVFGTSNKKKVYEQLISNPCAEWLAVESTNKTLRVSGAVEFEEDYNKKLQYIESNPMIKKIYNSRLDEFELFYLYNLEYEWFEMKIPTAKS